MSDPEAPIESDGPCPRHPAAKFDPTREPCPECLAEAIRDADEPDEVETADEHDVPDDEATPEPAFPDFGPQDDDDDDPEIVPDPAENADPNAVEEVEPIPFAEPDTECIHGVDHAFNECPKCDEAAFAALLTGEPGHVQTSRKMYAEGLAAFNVLRTHTAQGSLPYLVPLENASEREKARQVELCALTPLELFDRMAAAAGRDLADYARTGPVTLFAIIASQINQLNHLPGRTFSWYKNGRPRWLGTHVALIGPRRRGKGIELDFIDEACRNFLMMASCAAVVPVARVTLPGVFGGTLGKKWIPGAVERSNHGVLLWPELGNITGLLAGTGGTDAEGALADALSSGKYEQGLLKGARSYRSFSTWVGAIQEARWERLCNTITGIDTRFVVAYLPPLQTKEIVDRLAAGSEGHPLDPVALDVFAAKLAYAINEFAPTSLSVKPIEDRLIRLAIDGNLRVAEEDRQRWIAITLGGYVAMGGEIRGDIVLPDPWSVPRIREVLEADAKARELFRLSEGERLVKQCDHALADPRFSGPADEPRAFDIPEVIAYLSHALGQPPGTIERVVRGYSERGSRFSSFVDRRILRYVDIGEIVRPEIERRLAALHDADRTDAKRLEILHELTARGRGRPRKLYAYTPPEDRFFMATREDIPQ